MEFEDLKRKSIVNVLYRGKSGRGKTLNASKIALNVSKEDGKVLYMDTEGEGSTTMVNLIEKGNFEEEDVSNIEYRRVEDYSDVMEVLDKGHEFDLIVFDTLDSKHTMALRKVTDAKVKSDADWNEYPMIYSAEKEMMKKIRDTDCNTVCCLDPESGKMDKPKLCQTNVHGAFSIVVDLSKSGDEWNNSIRNWVGRGDAIGKGADNLVEALSKEVTERF